VLRIGRGVRPGAAEAQCRARLPRRRNKRRGRENLGAELAKRWSTFPALDRRACIAEVSGFEPSYVELLECVTMAGEARREDKGAKDGIPNVPTGVKKAKQ
jgi:hypothetical protein